MEKMVDLLVVQVGNKDLPVTEAEAAELKKQLQKAVEGDGLLVTHLPVMMNVVSVKKNINVVVN